MQPRLTPCENTPKIRRRDALREGVLFSCLDEEGKQMIQIVEKPIDSIKPYENNPRNNDDAVKFVANSIKEFGFKNPIIIDKNNVVVAGHTRLKAAKQLGMKKVPCIMADDLTPEQVKAFRLADNKTAELADWDYELLDSEMADITKLNMSDFGFEEIDNNVIGSLMDEGFSYVGRDLDAFSITFNFPIEHKEKMDEYIKKVGKDVIAANIIKMAEEEQYD